MKRKFYIGSFIAFFTLLLVSCAGVEEPKEEPIPLNISVIIDLSDRITKHPAPSQMSRDTAIINYLADYFKRETLGPQILKSKNSMRVFFYPEPEDCNISNLARNLKVDVATKKGVGKRMAVDTMKSVFQTTLTHIYEETLKTDNWPGADIWDFFNSGNVDDLCIKENARNILVILTDGELLYESTMRAPITKDGKKGYNYINKFVIEEPNSYLITDREGELKGKGLEVLMLEIIPEPQKRDRIKQLIGDWFKSMGIEKYKICETTPDASSTEMKIEKFLSM